MVVRSVVCSEEVGQVVLYAQHPLALLQPAIGEQRQESWPTVHPFTNHHLCQCGAGSAQPCGQKVGKWGCKRKKSGI